MIVNKKGSYIMEAAVVLPVIMLTVITCVLIIMYFYSSMSEQCSLHTELRKEAGLLTGNTEYLYNIRESQSEDRDIYVRVHGFGGTVYGKKYIIMQKKGVMSRKGVFAAEGSSCAADAPEFVRYCNFVKGLKDEQ